MIASGTEVSATVGDQRQLWPVFRPLAIIVPFDLDRGRRRQHALQIQMAPSLGEVVQGAACGWRMAVGTILSAMQQRGLDERSAGVGPALHGARSTRRTTRPRPWSKAWPCWCRRRTCTYRGLSPSAPQPGLVPAATACERTDRMLVPGADGRGLIRPSRGPRLLKAARSSPLSEGLSLFSGLVG